ncbi:MAG: SUF system Fe-S cluster assembly protein [Flavobacteriales bacterium]|nr:SUF system Fe-S cluster assembly protein [Flavobacteriales bacterium]
MAEEVDIHGVDKEEAKKILQKKIINMLKTIYDPEIPVDIFELGLIYEIRVDDDFNVKIEMTLTSPNCPVAESMPAEVKEKTGLVNGVKSADVQIVFDPPWNQDFMSEEAKLELGFL